MSNELPRVFTAFFLIFLSGSSILYSQKTAAETVSISDPAVLAEELKNLLGKYSRPGMTDEQIREALKGRPLGGSLTTDSFIAISPRLARYVAGMDVSRDGVIFRGHAYRLEPNQQFPEPEPAAYGLGGGTGTGLPRVSSRDELVRAYRPDISDTIWTDGSMRLKTVTNVPKSGTGSDPFNPQISRAIVPSPQTHYELAFRNAQPGQLINVEDTVFSLDIYDYTTVNGPGIIVWLPDELPGETRKDIDLAFIVKLAPPYFQSEEVSKPDTFTRKPHTAVRNKIYADIVDVWLRDSKTGEVLSKNALGVRQANDIIVSVAAPPLPRNRPLQILTKPSPQYTSTAREKGVNGTVVLRVTFLASGKIGIVSVVRGLPDGLTEQAVHAAKQIKFEPRLLNGVAVSVVKTIEYSFAVY